MTVRSKQQWEQIVAKSTCTNCGHTGDFQIQRSHYEARASFWCTHCVDEPSSENRTGEIVRSNPRAFAAEMKDPGVYGALEYGTTRVEAGTEESAVQLHAD